MEIAHAVVEMYPVSNDGDWLPTVYQTIFRLITRKGCLYLLMNLYIEV